MLSQLIMHNIDMFERNNICSVENSFFKHILNFNTLIHSNNKKSVNKFCTLHLQQYINFTLTCVEQNQFHHATLRNNYVLLLIKLMFLTFLIYFPLKRHISVKKICFTFRQYSVIVLRLYIMWY